MLGRHATSVAPRCSTRSSQVLQRDDLPRVSLALGDRQRPTGHDRHSTPPAVLAIEHEARIAPTAGKADLHHRRRPAGHDPQDPHGQRLNPGVVAHTRPPDVRPQRRPESSCDQLRAKPLRIAGHRRIKSIDPPHRGPRHDDTAPAERARPRSHTPSAHTKPATTHSASRPAPPPPSAAWSDGVEVHSSSPAACAGAGSGRQCERARTSARRFIIAARRPLRKDGLAQPSALPPLGLVRARMPLPRWPMRRPVMGPSTHRDRWTAAHHHQSPPRGRRGVGIVA